MNFIEFSAYFGLMSTLMAFLIADFISKKIKISFLSPFLLTIIMLISMILIFDINYEFYEKSASYLVYLLTPTTVCLAVPLYEKLSMLKDNLKAILISVTVGTITSMTYVYLFSSLFKLNYEQYLTLLPKSITTAIATGLIEEHGGILTLAIVAIVLTGTFGNCFAVIICKYAKISHPISKGLAIGTSSHGSGTARAMEMGEVEGAMSGLAMVLAGIITVITASFFAIIY